MALKEEVAKMKKWRSTGRRRLVDEVGKKEIVVASALRFEDDSGVAAKSIELRHEESGKNNNRKNFLEIFLFFYFLNFFIF